MHFVPRALAVNLCTFSLRSHFLNLKYAPRRNAIICFAHSLLWVESASSSFINSSRIASATANMFGSRFTPVHMTIGAIHEMTTLNGYRKLWENANHPVLTYILRSIAREEAAHVFMYSTIARIHLNKSKFREKLTDYIVEKFWTPVGQGSMREEDTNYVIRTLFSGPEGIKEIQKYVSGRMRDQFPGLEKAAQKVTDHISGIVGFSPQSTET